MAIIEDTFIGLTDKMRAADIIKLTDALISTLFLLYLLVANAIAVKDIEIARRRGLETILGFYSSSIVLSIILSKLRISITKFLV